MTTTTRDGRPDIPSEGARTRLGADEAYAVTDRAADPRNAPCEHRDCAEPWAVLLVKALLYGPTGDGLPAGSFAVCGGHARRTVTPSLALGLEIWRRPSDPPEVLRVEQFRFR